MCRVGLSVGNDGISTGYAEKEALFGGVLGIDLGRNMHKKGAYSAQRMGVGQDVRPMSFSRFLAMDFDYCAAPSIPDSLSVGCKPVPKVPVCGLHASIGFN